MVTVKYEVTFGIASCMYVNMYFLASVGCRTTRTLKSCHDLCRRGIVFHQEIEEENIMKGYIKLLVAPCTIFCININNALIIFALGQEGNPVKELHWHGLFKE